MRAAKLKERPDFALMKQTDIQNRYYMQMPLWLFYDPRYAELSLDAKVTYTFLLNRFQLSRKNGWVNDTGEVFVIFPRRTLAGELRICEQRVTAAFKALADVELIWEKRCGRGEANQIYLAAVKPMADPTYVCAPFFTRDDPDGCGSRTAEIAVLDDSESNKSNREAQNLRLKNHGSCGFKTADSEVSELQNLPSNKIDMRNIDPSYLESSQSVRPAPFSRRANEEQELLNILDACDLECFAPETARVFENAVERLYYSDSFRIGNATLPQSRIRAKLRQLDGIILQEVENKLHANLDHHVKNSTAYTMATLLNCIAESESDLMVDPYLNSLREPPGKR